jgi:hypothetical protein
MRSIDLIPKGRKGGAMMRILFHQDNCRRLFIGLFAGALTIVASTGAFCQAKITSIAPNAVQSGSKDISVNVYGTGFADAQQVWVACEVLAQPLTKQTDVDGKTYVVIPFKADQFQNVGPIAITTEACPPGGVPPKAAFAIYVSPKAGKPTFENAAPPGEGLIGVDVSAASSANPQAVFLALGVIDLALGGTSNIVDTGGKQLWLSGQLGLKGMAQPGALSGATSAGYYATAANATPDKIVQSVDASVHFGVQLRKPWSLPPAFNSGKTPSGDPSLQNTLVTLSLIVGGGAITPLSASQSTPPSLRGHTAYSTERDTDCSVHVVCLVM